MEAQSILILCVLGAGAFASAARAEPPSAAGCEFPDLSAMTPVSLQSGAAPAAGTGGDIPGGRWELVAARYTNSPVPITGQALGALELEAVTPTSGSGGVALDVTITFPANEQINETGAGPYSAADNVLDFQNDCGAETLLGQAEYSVDPGGTDPVMTLWGNVEIPDLSITILLEAEFLLVEPNEVDDPVFADRFEPIL